MQALELMKTHVVKTTPEAALSEAVDLMDLYQVSGLPVVDAAGKLCGMLTERDILRALLPEGTAILEDGGQAKPWDILRAAAEVGSRRVGEYMTQPAIFVTEHADVAEAALVMLTRHLKRLPVTNDDGEVLGTLNRVDVFQAIFEGVL